MRNQQIPNNDFHGKSPLKWGFGGFGGFTVAATSQIITHNLIRVDRRNMYIVHTIQHNIHIIFRERERDTSSCVGLCFGDISMIFWLLHDCVCHACSHWRDLTTTGKRQDEHLDLKRTRYDGSISQRTQGQ